MARSFIAPIRLVRFAALAALAVTAAVACAPGDDGHTPKLRKGAPSTSKAATEPGDADGGPVATETAPPADASPPGPAEVYVSDLDFTSTNGFGPLEKDMSNGEDAPNDGKMMSLGGTTYSKGLGVHADSEVTIALGGAYKTFLSDVGVDDEVEDRGSVVFQVLVDGTIEFDSGVMTGASETQKVSVDVTGKQELKLIVTSGGDDNGADHADWANARLVK